ncbi:hypothetical protein ABCL20_004485 [Vibrio alginolyticus]
MDQATRDIIENCGLEVEDVKPIIEAVKASAVINFVNTHIGAFEAGFIDNNQPTLAQLYRTAQHHVKDNYNYNMQSLSEVWGEELAKELAEITPYIQVKWHSPEETPQVESQGLKKFWVAIKVTGSINQTKKSKTFVISAYYVNKPLELDEHGEVINGDPFVSIDGEPIEAVGFHSCKEHQEFDGYYEPLPFGDDYELLGWAEYQKPDFDLNTKGAK